MGCISPPFEGAEENLLTDSFTSPYDVVGLKWSIARAEVEIAGSAAEVAEVETVRGRRREEEGRKRESLEVVEKQTSGV